MKVALCTPTLTKPFPQYRKALKASLPLLEAAGWTASIHLEVGCPYISRARSKLLHAARDADAVIFIDHDLSWQPDALLRLLQVPDEVVCGTYRFKREPVAYIGQFGAAREDGCVSADFIPGGFLKLTRDAVKRFKAAYPELVYGQHLDLFNHGAFNGTWWSEDYAFARRWRDKCGAIWLVPDLQIDHHTATASFPGNYFLDSR